MSLEAVIEYFSEYKMDHRVMVLENSTATVEEAAQAHGVDPDQIGKTMSFKIDGEPILIVVAGKARKVSSALPLVYLLMIFKDKRQVAMGVDEKGLYAITAALKIAGQRNDDISNSLVYTSL